MKNKLIVIFATLLIIILCGYWFMTNYPRVSESITLKDGTEIRLVFTENTLTFLDPEVKKTLNIKYNKNELKYEAISEDYQYNLFLIDSLGHKRWIIKDRYWPTMVAPYSGKKLSFKECYNYDIKNKVDTLYTITFNDFKLKVN